jgi:DNA-binding MarR family transcriptional regulator
MDDAVRAEAPMNHDGRCRLRAEACAARIFDLLPLLRRFVTARVSLTGVDLGISLRQFAALRGIRDGATSPGELARLWHVTPAVITGIVDRLEVRGLVRREADPADRRRLRLVLTDAGVRASDEMERGLTGDLTVQLKSASLEELGELERSLDLLQHALTDLHARLPGSEPLCVGDQMPIWEEDAPTDAETALARAGTRRQHSFR